jgi:hypothetical protein
MSFVIRWLHGGRCSRAIITRWPRPWNERTGDKGRSMRWTLTIKDQTHGVHTAITKYECRVARSGSDIRLSFQNLMSGSVKEGRFLMPTGVARSLGNALLLACTTEGDRVNVVFQVDESKTKE